MPSMNTAAVVKQIRMRLRSHADKEKARILRGFFKTGPGQYGAGDVFLGVVVPVLRKLVNNFPDAGANEAAVLLRSPIHEERLLALFFLIRAFAKSDAAGQKTIYRLYCANIRSINNWDLVDLSAPHIVGAYLLDKNRTPLYTMAKSSDLWEKRIAILATFAFIRQNDFTDALKISVVLLKDKHDLIHKAVGWMLREIGKRSMHEEEAFLKQHYHGMPRTMLRYAIERFPETRRQGYLKGIP